MLAVTGGTPRVLCVDGDDLPRLPAGRPSAGDRTLELALRRFANEQAGLDLGYVEQLYTFGDMNRAGRDAPVGARVLSVAYLALVHETTPLAGSAWSDVYDLLPWEDHRGGRPPVLDDRIVPALARWAAKGSRAERLARAERADIAFGLSGAAWDGVRTLERYELLYEAGLVGEAAARPGSGIGLAMAIDHRRMVATALGRLRGKVTYRPVVFELLPETFTLLQLQRVVEALLGRMLHKQNFRRLVEGAGLVEPTGERQATSGRPAATFRFRREVLRERARPGVAPTA